MNKKNITLDDLGYDEFFRSEQRSLGLTEKSIGRIIAEYREAYRVKGIDGEYLAKITGKQMFTATKREDYPAVGDWVAIEKLSNKKAIIVRILTRKTILKKKYSGRQDNQIIATNIDTAFITESMDNDYNLNRFERYLVLVEEGKINPIIILNKIDLISDTELNVRIENLMNRFKGIDIISTSIFTKQGFNELSNYIIKGKTYCFLGSSGVGKSSLINKLLGKNEIKTREISFYTGKGKHTTTTREMYFLENGGILIDNPGTREVGIADSGMGMDNVFEEIRVLSKACKYSNCSHMHEPDCAVLKAIDKNELDKDKYNNYIKLKQESDYYNMTNLEKRQKNRKFGQFIKKAQKEI